MKSEDINAIPTAVRHLINGWKADGCPTQCGIDWPREQWIVCFPNWKTRFDELPDQLSRQDVFAQVQKTQLNAEDTEWAFLLVMAWGFGKVGYGRWRASNILARTPDSREQLLKVREILHRSDAISGYEALGGACRLPHLGPAFGTKFLYFLGPSEPAMTPLILDKLVTSWLYRNTGLSLNSLAWSTSTYRDYLLKMRSWAEKLDVSPVDIETCIFQNEADTRPDNQWANVTRK